MNVYGNIVGIVTVIVVTPPIHRAVNIIGFRMKKKEVPW
jgi:CDP-2,3-bis-(O-geranylgeranyl)-sn-glycerol synthase